MDMPQPVAPLSGAASPTPVLTPGALSPDGVWRWDGLGWVPSVAVSTPAYRPLGLRPRLAGAFLLVAGLTQLVNLGALTGRLDLIGRIGSGAGVSIADAQHSDDVVRAAAFIEIGATIVCAVFFLTWLHRIVANNAALGARALRFTPGAAVGWWFVPFANWWVPFRVLGESWRAADPQLPRSTPDQRAGRAVPAVLNAWFLCLAGGSLLASLGNITSSGSASDLDTLHTATLMFMAASVLLAVAAVLGTMLVSRLSRRQDALRDTMFRPAQATA